MIVQAGALEGLSEVLDLHHHAVDDDGIFACRLMLLESRFVKLADSSLLAQVRDQVGCAARVVTLVDDGSLGAALSAVARLDHTDKLCTERTRRPAHLDESVRLD